MREVHRGLRKDMGVQQGWVAGLDLPLGEDLKTRGGSAGHLRLGSF